MNVNRYQLASAASESIYAATCSIGDPPPTPGGLEPKALL